MNKAGGVRVRRVKLSRHGLIAARAFAAPAIVSKAFEGE